MKWSPIRLSPVEYVNQPGILKDFHEIIQNKEYQHPTILTDQNVIQATKEFLPDDFYERYSLIIFGGNCTYEEADRVKALVDLQTDVLIALGGGQLMDTAKNVADWLKLDLINVPTVPSNCASIATKSMVYSEKNHELVGRERHPQAVTLVLVDPEVLRQAPKNYILSGIGDTLAKWYEIRRRLLVPAAQGAALDIARRLIEVSKERTLAIMDLSLLDDKEVFSNLLDTIFLIAASVDGFASTRGRSVAAHSFNNGYLKVNHHPIKTHGEVVSFGVLTQLAVEQEFDELNQLIPFYEKIGLPTKLSDLNLTADTPEITTIAADMVDKDNVRIQTVYPGLPLTDMVTAINYFKG